MIDYKNPNLIIETSQVEEGRVSWRSPSNLAIIKYWGKYGLQLPQNPSLSFTLDNAYTETTLAYEPNRGVDTGTSLSFFFEGEKNEAFEKRIGRYLSSLWDIFPFLRQLKLTIHSANSFPHSAGIASSASSMSALALCLCSLEHHFFKSLDNDQQFEQKASFVARLGSGSACRSIFAEAAIWGESGEVPGSSNFYAIPFANQLHPVFKTYHDDILLIKKDQKAVSSSAGHRLMEGNIYAESRYKQARQNLHNLLSVLKEGDVDAFGKIAESEALVLHALMMASNPPYLLLAPNTVTVIDKIKTYRVSTGEPLYFSLDAGPNIHLLYPDTIKTDVQNFIRGELSEYCVNGEWIEDGVGKGPVQLEV